METQVQQKIIRIIQNLDHPQMSEVLDFLEFIKQKQRKKLADPKVIDSICGKHKKDLLSSTEFALQKEDEIKIEEHKWQRR